MTSQSRNAQRVLALTSAAVGLLVAGTGVALAGYWFTRRGKSLGSPEHAAPDLALDRERPGATDRAPPAFRPDPTAPVSAAERESLRPATGPSPSILTDRGGVRSQP